MNYTPYAILAILGVLAGILLMIELGRRIGLLRLEHHGEHAMAGLGTVEGAVFAVLGLLLAFTFSGAAQRFDARRQLVLQESNIIGTAYLRLDLLPPETQPELRELFRNYVNLRISVYRKVSSGMGAIKAELAACGDAQKQIWTRAVAASRNADSPTTRALVLPAINEMIDITTTRTVAAQTHPPAVVFIMLFILVMASSFLAGHAMAIAKYRGRLHTICFAIVMTAAVYVIIDFEFPRFGLIRIDSFDQLLVDVRDGMK